MDYTYNSVGGVELFGCSDYIAKQFRYFNFAIGSIVFSAAKARKGIYEKIAIKEVLFPKPQINLYVDTYNGLWNENELVVYSEASQLVNEYILEAEIANERLLKSC